MEWRKIFSPQQNFVLKWLEKKIDGFTCVASEQLIFLSITWQRWRENRHISGVPAIRGEQCSWGRQGKVDLDHLHSVFLSTFSVRGGVFNKLLAVGGGIRSVNHQTVNCFHFFFFFSSSFCMTFCKQFSSPGIQDPSLLRLCHPSSASEFTLLQPRTHVSR